MPQKFHNKKTLEKTRRILRQKQTKPEILVWSRLRNNQLGYKFRRQHSIGPFVADFYCAQLKLIVELDGPIHYEEENIKKDKIREEYLIENGFIILHFHTVKVMDDLETVIYKIKMACDELSRETSTSPSLSSSEERD